MRIRTITVGVCLLVCLTACAGPADSTDGASRVTPTPKAATPTPASPTPVAPLQIGQELTWKDGAHGASGTTVVLAYQQPAKGSMPPGEGLGVDDAVWATVEVKVCNKQGPDISSDQQPWSLAFADGTRTQTTGLNGGDLPKPEYPTLPTVVKAGDCLRGKIPFPVSKDRRPTKIIYQSASALTSTEWAVPAS
ncbi:hypothetical protein [Streptomyces sp. PvR034]|uniref:hypothetical protein n=1 Tax=Streptomyces sp. PvR034 TaxID=3156401 RepID=UPI0033988939